MNYLRVYNILVCNARERGLNKSILSGYYEKHHIIPKCVGGSDEDDNFVLLTAREHYLAHMLLWKIHPNEDKLVMAAYLMCKRRKGAGGKIEIQTGINSREYAKLREAYCSAMSIVQKGENNGFYGRKHSQETKDKILKTRIARGTARRPEDRIKILKGKPLGEKHHMWGKSHSPESIEKIRQTYRDKDIRPWENFSSQDPLVQLKWANADKYYDFWVSVGRCGLKKMTRLYNEAFNSNVNLAFFTNPRVQFLKGWVPSEDTKWIKFKEAYFGSDRNE